MKLIRCVNELTQTSLFPSQKMRSTYFRLFLPPPPLSLPFSICLSVSPLGSKLRRFTQHYSLATCPHTIFPFPLPLWLLGCPDHLTRELGPSVSRELPRLRGQGTSQRSENPSNSSHYKCCGGKAGPMGCECIYGHSTRPAV